MTDATDEEKGELVATLQRQESNSGRIWSSCCLRCDKAVVQYVTKTMFAGSILAFACVQIATNTDPCNPLMSWYTSMIGLVAGSYIEQAGSHSLREEK